MLDKGLILCSAGNPLEWLEEFGLPLMKNYETELNSLYVYDDGVVKGFIKIEDTYIARLFVEPVLLKREN